MFDIKWKNLLKPTSVNLYPAITHKYVHRTVSPLEEDPMTDYGQGAEPLEPGDHQTPEPDENVTEDALVTEDTAEASVAEASSADFSSGEGMVALAGLIIIGVWLIFEVLTRQYSLTTFAIVLGAGAALIPRMSPEAVAKIMPVPAVMKVLGYALVLVGVIEVVTDIRIGIYDSPMAVLGALIAYGAYGLAFMGARQIET